jgi:hypothetical protein
MKGLNLGNKNMFIFDFCVYLHFVNITSNGCAILKRLCVAGGYVAKGGRNGPYFFNWFKVFDYFYHDMSKITTCSFQSIFFF